MQLAQPNLYLNCKFKMSTKPTHKIHVTLIKSPKFTSSSKILNTNQMSTNFSLSIHYSKTELHRFGFSHGDQFLYNCYLQYQMLELGFHSWHVQTFSFLQCPDWLWSSPIQIAIVYHGPYWGVKWLGCSADHSSLVKC